MHDNEGPRSRAAFVLAYTRGFGNIGVTFTMFGLDVWIYKKTGSYAVFAYVALLASLPGLIFAPIAGVITDRFDKKLLILSCDIVSIAAVCTAMLLHQAQALDVAAVAVIVPLLSLVGGLRWIALSAFTTSVVAKADLGRMNAVLQSFEGVNVMLGPVLGAVGFEMFGLGWLLFASVLAQLVGLAGILWVRSPPSATRGTSYVFASFWQELTFGFHWVFGHAGLRRLVLFFMLLNVALSVNVVTFTPYILSFASSYHLGLFLGVEGAGAFIAGILLGRYQGRLDHERQILLGSLVFGACLVGWGMARDEWLLLALSAGFGILMTVVSSSNQTIWQTEVPLEIQGKVFSVRRMLAFGLTPLAILLSVPLATNVFEPLLGGIAWVGRLWGSPPAGSLGLMLSALGALIIAFGLFLWSLGGLRVGRTGVVLDKIQVE
jgi:DHA3 family macrolide efflux protein-like MFS transporter